MTDHLLRQPYLNLLKSIITTQCNNSSGYSFAIDGEWGCDKTWILNELEKQLTEKKENKFIIFHYNAWKNDFYDEPLVALLSVMIESLKKYKKSITETGSVSKLISSSITTLMKIVGNVVEKKYNLNPNDIIDSVKDSGKAIANIKLTKSDFNKLLPLENALNQIKDIITKLAKSAHIILIIDELDRCLPEYAIKVLERLHHICNEMPITQILAINKSVLVDSISTVFGKNYSNTDNHDRWNTFFADSYLQKFLDVSIPLPTGTLDSRLGILNGLEKNYVPYIRPTNFGQEFIKLDEEFLILFITTLINGIEIRLQEKIFKQVELCHKLTIDSGINLNQERCTYAILIYEIISCICRYVFHLSETCKILEGNENYSLVFSHVYLSSSKVTKVKYDKFNENLKNFLVSGIRNVTYTYQNYPFEIIDTKTYIMAYFLGSTKRSIDTLQNYLFDRIFEDKIFLQKYDEIMNIIIGN
ncbi:MAG: AAA family ATPase [Spirochaetaceae bacterium]|nr:AAA family ATPase [Spirochaetaceae bacterium]